MRDTFTRCLEAYAETHPELVLVTGDLGFGVLFPYMKKFPDSFINAGISEQAMMSMAAGMALEGKTVVVYSIGNFPTLRCLEQDVYKRQTLTLVRVPITSDPFLSCSPRRTSRRTLA